MMSKRRGQTPGTRLQKVLLIDDFRIFLLPRTRRMGRKGVIKLETVLVKVVDVKKRGSKTCNMV